MECNRDEAIKAMKLAESKFRVKDIMGAKKFALKAHKLFPGLEGIPQMLATFEVYHAVERKVRGEIDWYGVLDVSSTVDDETLKRKYRKLVLLLHPDKNKSIGADGAFKLVSEAWSVLSDKARRLAYDQKRNIGGWHQKVPQQSRDQSATNTETPVSNVRPPKPTANLAPSSVPTASCPPGRDTFWTACPRCKVQFKYHLLYLNRVLFCPTCKEAFLAVEKTPMSSSAPASLSFSQHFQKNAGHMPINKNAYVPGRDASGAPKVGTSDYPLGTDAHSFNHVNFQKGPCSKTTGVASTTSSSLSPSETEDVLRHSYEKFRKRIQDACERKKCTSRKASFTSSPSNSNAASSVNAIDQQCATPMVERPAKKQRFPDDGGGHISRGSHMGQAVGGFKEPTITATERVDRFPSTLIDTQTMLMGKAKMEIRKKLNEWSLASAAKAIKGKEREAVTKCDQSNLHGPLNEKKNVLKVSLSNPSTHPSKEMPEPVLFDVPDPDFHDFDKDRTEQSFEGNQVWAAYDDDDGMPRFYALIHKVMSLHPFKMKLSWLNSKTNTELGPLNWISSGFQKTCGEFRVGRHEARDTVNIFSHRVRWEKGLRGSIRIFPMKGDVWALYRNWSPDWNETTPDEVMHKYDMVEVLDAYSEDQGVSITPLVKVQGFKTVFKRHVDPNQVRRIPKEEMFRFSHQVPSWLLTIEEAENAPRGCLELDPAATPLELLKVMTEINGEVAGIA